MKEQGMTRTQLIDELIQLRQLMADLQKADTERRGSEQALKEHSERLEEVLEERAKELHDAQEEVVRKEKLATVGELAAGVGHELRNPLAVIANAVYYLQLTLTEADETTKEYLDIISSEVRKTGEIVSALLDLTRTFVPDREKTAISELVSRSLGKRPAPEGVEVTSDIPSELPAVFVDPRQMQQVLDNLVTNAYQAMPQGGSLTISARGDKGAVRVSVVDTGAGISRENLKKIFEPLFTTRGRGIGLGLAVSKRLVEANGAWIEVQSEEGKGSTFTLVLPTSRPDPEAPRSTIPP